MEGRDAPHIFAAGATVACGRAVAGHARDSKVVRVCVQTERTDGAEMLRVCRESCMRVRNEKMRCLTNILAL